MSSSELPPGRTATTASTPESRTVPRFRGSRTSPSRPFSMTSDGTITAGRPAASAMTMSRYSMPPSQRQWAARLVTVPSIPAKAPSSGRSRRLVWTITAGASQASAASTASVASENTPTRRRGRTACSRVRRLAMGAKYRWGRSIL